MATCKRAKSAKLRWLSVPAAARDVNLKIFTSGTVLIGAAPSNVAKFKLPVGTRCVPKTSAKFRRQGEASHVNACTTPLDSRYGRCISCHFPSEKKVMTCKQNEGLSPHARQASAGLRSKLRYQTLATPIQLGRNMKKQRLRQSDATCSLQVQHRGVEARRRIISAQIENGV